MGARADLDLSEILPQYQEFLVPEPPRHAQEPLEAPTEIYPEPTVVGWGPIACSSSVALEPARPRFCDDVNGYYRALGIPFPYVNATREQLREAYQAKRGWESIHLTYYLKQLLNPAVRERYDRMPLGQVFLDDDFVQNRVKNAATREANRRAHRTGVSVSPTTVLDEWGLRFIPATSEDSIDGAEREVLDQDSLVCNDHPPSTRQWTFSHLLWRCVSYDRDRLAQWQEGLISALAERGEVMRFAVGFVGKTNQPFIVEDVKGVLTFFLNEHQEPSTGLATRAAHAACSLTEQSITPEETMTDTAAPPVFAPKRTGMDAAKKASDAKNSLRFSKVHFLSLEDEESVILRFFTEPEEWPTYDQHDYAPVQRPNPDPDTYKKWPQVMTATCRYDDTFEGYYKDCYVCDNKLESEKYKKRIGRRPMTWALAVRREAVIGDGSEALGGPDKKGLVVGTKDAVREIDEVKDGKATGNTIKELDIVVLNFAYSNFFSGLKVWAGEYGTICDRDYKITREGSDKGTQYRPIPRDPQVSKGEVFKPGHPSWGKYAEAVKEQGLDVNKMAQDKATDEFYARFFDVSKPFPESKRSKSESNGTTESDDGPINVPSAATSEADPEKLAAIREKLRPKAATAEESKEAEETEAAPASTSVDLD